MKPNDLSQFDLHHLPPCDPEGPFHACAHDRVNYTRIEVPVDRPSMNMAAPAGEADLGGGLDLDLLRLENMRQRNRNEMRGIALLVDIERARRAMGKHIKIGAVFIVRDPVEFESIDFPGQIESFGREGRSKKFDCGNWLVELVCLDPIDRAEGAYGDDDNDTYGEQRPSAFADRAL